MEAVVEKNLRDIGIYKIAGCDEVGRGCLSHSVVSACVMLPANHKIDGINDSKKISPKKRKELYKQIYEQAIDVKVAECSPQEIDKINILNATKKCIISTIKSMRGNPDIFIVDGLFDFKEDCENYPYQTLPKGDSLCEAVAAASIVAKVYRDTYMVEVAHEMYPQYGFDKHMGYGTKQHIEALLKYGPCPMHRMSFSIKGVYLKDL